MHPAAVDTPSVEVDLHRSAEWHRSSNRSAPASWMTLDGCGIVDQVSGTVGDVTEHHQRRAPADHRGQIVCGDSAGEL